MPDEIRTAVRRDGGVRPRPGGHGAGRRDRAYQLVMEWMATHAGKIRGGNKLQPPETATTVRLDRGDPVITDGPFVEGKEVVSGYTEIEVADLGRGAAHGQHLARLPDRRDTPAGVMSDRGLT